MAAPFDDAGPAGVARAERPARVAPQLVHELKNLGGHLFEKRGSLLALWQEIAENFYPQRADFTTTRYLGTDFASNLMTSYPILVHRDLSNSIGAMSRPTAKEWFKTRSEDPEKEDTEGKQFLAALTTLQRNAMYDTKTMLVRACKEADADYAAFGQAVIQCEVYRNPETGERHLLHKCHHLRDVAWSENVVGKIDTVFRKCKLPRIQVIRTFPNTVHPDVEKKAEKEPWEEHEFWHVILPAFHYAMLEGARKIKQPFISIYFDPAHNTILEEVGSWVQPYVIPRWSTVSGSQYAHSPATIAALPDGRLIQDVARVLLEAGQKAVNPPMIAVRDAIRSDIDIEEGGVTWVDSEYQEHLDQVLRPITRDDKGLTFGMEFLQDLRTQLSNAFYLNKLNLPPAIGGKDMTAYEVGQRVQEFIRNVLPLFEPLETDYNGQLCEVDLQLLLRNRPDVVMQIPLSLRGQGYAFTFKSPLTEALDKQRVGDFQQAAQILGQAQALDATAAYIINGKVAVRETMEAVVPANWLNDEDTVDKAVANAQSAMKQQQMLEMLTKGSAAAKDAGTALNQGAQGVQAGGLAG